MTAQVPKAFIHDYNDLSMWDPHKIDYWQCKVYEVLPGGLWETQPHLRTTLQPPYLELRNLLLEPIQRDGLAALLTPARIVGRENALVQEQAQLRGNGRIDPPPAQQSQVR